MTYKAEQMVLPDETKEDIKLDTIESAIEDIKAGKIVIVVDDEDRENEGDFVCAAECITPDLMNFMITNGRGLICAPITAQRAKELDLRMMVTDNSDPLRTAFTVSVDYKHKGCTTGISSYDRATCIQSLCDDSSNKEDFSRPGHIFPLIAKQGGVLRRTGHTEAAVDLATLAGYKSAGVLTEILNADGSMARLPQLKEIATKHELKIISIKDLITYRLRKESLIEKVESKPINTNYGQFELLIYKEKSSNNHHFVLKLGKWSSTEAVLTRVHSGSNLVDLFSYISNTNNNRIAKSLEKISEKGAGLLVLLRNNPFKENDLNESISSFEKLINGGLKNSWNNIDEQKDIGIGSQILLDLNVHNIELITTQPKKRVALEGYGIEIVKNVIL